ncbi:MAG: flagellin [Pseudomonadota bacterium]|nr:flagellin [Pseudomonadota bacterium]
MVTRISTSFLNSTLVNRLQTSNVQIAKNTYQISSGLEARRYEDISTETNALFDLKELRSSNERYIRNIEDVTARLSSSENALQGLSDLMADASNLWTLGRNENSAESRAALAPKAEALTRTFYQLFQTQFEGRYIFSGQASENPPLNQSPTANISPGNPAPTTYYTGDVARPSVITGEGIQIPYGVTGDQQGFADMLAGLEALWFGLENNSTTEIDNAIELLNNAQTELSDMLGEIGGQIESLNLLKDRHESANINITERVDDIEKADITEAISNYSANQAVLESSMAILARLQSTSLLDFI